MRGALLCVVLSFIAFARPSFAQVPARDRPEPTGTAAVRGRVLLAGSDQPLARVNVRATSSVLKAPRIVRTDRTGRYEIGGLPPGRYLVSAIKSNYVTSSFGERRPGAPGKPFELADGQMAAEVNFALTRAGVIAGRIVDEFGEPFPNVQVAVMRFQHFNGQRRLVPAQSFSSTNDLGLFRLFGIAPGEYFLSASYRTGFGNTDDRFGYAPTYYPGTTSIGDAQRIAIVPGQVVGGMVLTLLLTRSARVSGIAIDASGKPMSGARVMATPKDGMFFASMHSAVVRPDGSFTVTGLTPGDYVLRTGTPMDEAGESASAPVTVSGSDVTDVQLAGVKPSTVTGRVEFEGAPPPISSVRVSLMRQDVDLFGTASARVHDNLTFEVKTTPCRCVLSAFAITAPAANLGVFSPPPDQWRVKRVTLNGEDVTDPGFDVAPNVALGGMVVEMTTRASEISGVVTDESREPDREASVVAFSQDPLRWRTPWRFVVQTRMGAQEQYHLRLPAGDYFVVAVDALENGEWQDPDVLARLRQSAVAVSIAEDEKKPVDLKVVPKPF